MNNNQFQQQLQYSPTISQSARSSPPEKPHHRHTSSSSSSIHSGTKDVFINDHSTTNDHHQSSPYSSPSNFIRVHFPNKHTTAVSFLKKNYFLIFFLINLAVSKK